MGTEDLLSSEKNLITVLESR